MSQEEVSGKEHTAEESQPTTAKKTRSAGPPKEAPKSFRHRTIRPAKRHQVKISSRPLFSNSRLRKLLSQALHPYIHRLRTFRVSKPSYLTFRDWLNTHIENIVPVAAIYAQNEKRKTLGHEDALRAYDLLYPGHSMYSGVMKHSRLRELRKTARKSDAARKKTAGDKGSKGDKSDMSGTEDKEQGEKGPEEKKSESTKKSKRPAPKSNKKQVQQQQQQQQRQTRKKKVTIVESSQTSSVDANGDANEEKQQQVTPSRKRKPGAALESSLSKRPAPAPVVDDADCDEATDTDNAPQQDPHRKSQKPRTTQEPQEAVASNDVDPDLEQSLEPVSARDMGV